MAINPRNKGQFLQPGMYCFYPNTAGTDLSVVSHDGTLACDSVHLQADYPELFATIGITWNKSGQGDDDLTQFRTPPVPTWANDIDVTCRVRF